MIPYLFVVASSVLCGVVLGYAIADARSRKREILAERESMELYVQATTHHQQQTTKLLQEHAADITEVHAAHAKILENIITYNRPEKPVASVLDPGPTDAQGIAEIELREREVDILTTKIMEESEVVVSPERARQEAERMLSYVGE